MPSSESNGYYMPPRYENDNGACKLRITAPCKLGGGGGGGEGRGNAESRNTKFYFYLSGGEMPSHSTYSSPLPPSSKQNPSRILLSFYRITRYMYFFVFNNHFLVDPPRVQRNRRRYSKGYARVLLYEALFFCHDTFEKYSANICRGTNPVSSMRRRRRRRRLRATFNRDTRLVPFKVVSRKTQDCRNIKHGLPLARARSSLLSTRTNAFLQHNAFLPPKVFALVERRFTMKNKLIPFSFTRKFSHGRASKHARCVF